MGFKKDLTGQVFGRLTVVGYIEGKSAWRCICKCGNDKIARTGRLNNGYVRSCGCLAREGVIERNKTRDYGPSKIADLTGQTINEWKIIRYLGKQGKYHKWLCQCSCGTVRSVDHHNLTGALTNCCGCIRKAPVVINRKLSTNYGTHKMSKSSTYISWSAMWARTSNPNHEAYERYAGKGIIVEDPRWEKFENFLEDMGERPEGKSLDRVDNNKGYYRENCRWATPYQQNNNAGNTRLIAHNGKTKTISEWAKDYGISRDLLAQRIYQGWPIEKALTPSSKRSLNQPITYNGKTMRLTEWAQEVDVPLKILKRRIFSQGWSIEKALTTPRQITGRMVHRNA